MYDAISLLRESYRALLGFIIVVLVGALYLQQAYHGGFAASLYESLKLLAFQSSHNLPSDLAGQLVFFLVPIFGLVLIVQSVLRFGRLLLDKSSHIENWQVALASTYRGHVIVCGLGRVGVRVVTQLVQAGCDVVVIEPRWENAFVARALALRVPVVVGDAREPTALRRAGLIHARAVVAAIDNDLLDVEIALAARAIQPGIRVILRAFSEQLDRNLERHFGVNSVFSTSALAAPTFAAAAVSADLDYVLPVGDGKELLGVAHMPLSADAPPIETHTKLEERFGVRILEIQDAPGGRGRRFAATDTPRTGATLTLVGSLRALTMARAALTGTGTGTDTDMDASASPHPPRPATDETTRETILICGLGKVGFRVATWLALREPRPRVVIITTDDTSQIFRRDIAALEGVEVFYGDARDGELLRQAGITSASALAAITSDDQMNLHIALEARRINPGVHIVLRVFSDALAEKMTELFGIHTAYSTSELASPTLAAAAAIGDINSAFAAGHTLFAAQTLTLAEGSPLAGRAISAIRAREGALVVWRRRGLEARRLPPPETTLTPGDEITLLARLDALEHLRAAR